MTKSSLSKAELRRQAEAELDRKQTPAQPMAEIDSQRLVHELQVHQIELEMQNEELQSTRQELEAILEQYTDLYEYAPLGYFTLTRDSTIQKVNLAGAALLGVTRAKLIQRRLGLFVSEDYRPVFNEFIERIMTYGKKETCEIHLANALPDERWVHLTGACSEDGLACRLVVTDITERKRVEETLRFQAQIMDQAHEAIVVTDVKGLIVSLNRGAERLLGYSEEEALGKSVSFVYPQDQLSLLTEEIQPQVRKKGWHEVETRFRKKSGEEVPVDLALSALKDTKGEVIGMIGSAIDITERKRVEETLRFQAQIMDQAREGIVVIDTRRFVISWNRGAERLLGYSAEEALGQPIIFVYPKDQSSILTDENLQKIRENGWYESEVRLRKKSGEVIQALLTLSALKDAKGVEIGIIGSAIDITEHKAAEVKLEEERILLRTLIDNLPDPICVKDIKGRKLIANTADWKASGGKTMEDILGKTDFETYPLELAQDFWAADRSVFDSGLPIINREEAALNSQGKPVITLSTKVPLRDLQGSIVGLVGISRDITMRRATERKLEEERILMRTLIDNLPDLIFVMDKEGRKIISNMADWKASGGKTMEDILGKTDLETYPPELAQEFWAADRSVIDSGTPVINREEIGRDPQGKPISMLSSKIPLRDSQGNIIGLVGTSRDISERKRVEEALRHSNRELRAISSCNQILMRAEDEQTLLDDICQIICNEAGYRMAWVGYAENDAAKTVRPVAWAGYEEGYLASAAITWADTERGHGPSGCAIRNGESSSQDFVTSPSAAPWRESGLQRGYRTGIALPLKDESANVFGVLNLYSGESDAFTQDERRLLEELAGDLAFGITVLRARAKRKQTEEALKESEEKYRAIFENTQDIYYETAIDGIVLEVSPSIELASKGLYHRQDLIGKSISDFYADPKNLDDLTAAIQKTGRVVDFEIALKNRDLSLIPCSLSAKIQFDAQGKPEKIIGSLHDISERKQSEQKLKEYSEHLEEMVEKRTRELRDAQEQLVRKEKLAVMGQLAGSVSHELRNPLGVISNSVYYLKLVQPDANDKVKKHHALIEQEVHNAAQIVGDLLDYAREISTVPKPGSVPELVEHTLSRFPVPASIQVSLNIPADLPQVYADPLHVEQILGNLITNACQAMVEPSDSKRAGSTTLQNDGQLTLSVAVVAPLSTQKQKKPMVAISVKDTGSGISPENMKKIFEPLFSTKINGIGLGLAVSKKLAEVNGGRIEMESEEGKGSTFTLYLPVKEDV